MFTRERIKTIYFVGPSLYNARPDPLDNELWFGPARQGDVIKAYLEHTPETVCLIDGYLRRDFPTWVKELCYVMADGSRFVGASSIGAIRAAELHRYGAVGIGAIFSAYASGRVEAENYVVLEFHPRTFQPLSNPPCTNIQKQRDALGAVEYCRTVKGKPVCTFSKKDLGFGLQLVLDRVLANDYLVTHGGRLFTNPIKC